MFDPGNWFWRNVARAGDLIGLSLCWLFCSLPLFTAGAATAALYDAVVHCVRREEGRTFARYFRAFRDNFKPSLILTLAFLAAEGLILCSRAVSYQVALNGSAAASVLFYADYIFLCVPLAVWLMGMAALSRFTFRGAELALTALKLSIRYLPAAALSALLAVAAALLVRVLVIPIAILPGVAALLISLPLERVFRPYQERETTAPEDE